MGTQKNAPEACAPKDPSQLSWNRIPWSVYWKRVRKLQFRIAKAFREGRTGKMNVLQRMLTRSLAAKALAVKRVTENKGKQTPGIDHVLWKTPEERLKVRIPMKIARDSDSKLPPPEPPDFPPCRRSDQEAAEGAALVLCFLMDSPFISTV